MVLEQLLSGALVLRSSGVSLTIVTESTKLANFFLLDPAVPHHIPDVSVSRYSSQASRRTFALDKALYEAPYTIFVEDSDSAHEVQYDFTGKSLKITGRLGKDYREINILYAAQHFISRLLQEKHVFGIHCGAVSDAAGATIIVGNDRAGKSTIVLRLCSEGGFQYLSDEKSIVKSNDCSHVSWIGGNAVVSARQDIYQYVSRQTILPIFTDISISATNSKKIYFRTHDFTRVPIPIDCIVFPRLDMQHLSCTKIDCESAVYRIFANMSAEIHGLNGAFVNARFALPSLDDDFIRQSRLQTAIDMCAHVPAYICEGPMNDICDMIGSLRKTQ